VITFLAAVSFKRQSSVAFVPLWFAHLFLFESAPKERDIKAPEKQSEWSQQCDYGASSVPLVEDQRR